MPSSVDQLKKIANIKKELLEKEQQLLNKRRESIANLAEEFNLLTASDTLLAGIFAEASEALEKHPDRIKTWETLGGRFRKAAKPGSRTVSKSKPTADTTC